MEEEKIKALEEEIKLIKNKLNEIVACLSENNLNRKVEVEYLFEEEEVEDEE